MIVGLFIIVTSFILLLHTTHAAIINQPIDTYLDGISSFLYQNIGTSTQSGTVSGITVKSSAYLTGSPTLRFRISTTSFAGTIDPETFFLEATSTQPSGDADGSHTDFVTFSFAPFTFNPAWNYCFRLDANADSGANWWRGGNNSNNYLTSAEDAKASGCNITSFGTVKDAYFVWTEGAAPPTAEIVFPEDQTSVFDPNFNWIINASTSTGSIGIFYGTSSTTPQYFDGYFSIINGTSTYPKGTPLFNGTYYAWVAIYAATEAGEQIATSSVITFDVGFGGGSSGGSGSTGDWSLSSSTLCANIQAFATATYIGQFSNAVLDGSCKALIFAFFPSTSSVQKIVDIKDLIFDKPPIGYFVAISNALDLSTTTEAFSFPTSTFAGIQEVVIDPIDIFFPSLVGLSTGVWIFKRFSKKDKL